MQFSLITNEVLRVCLSNLLMNNYKKSYADFRKFVKLEISEEEYSEFKKRQISEEEINKIILRNKFDSGKEVNRISSIWILKEKEIIKTITELTGISINTENITCFIDPYQNGGYYGEDNITVGTYKNPEDILFIIAHELFHVFYWRKLAELKITESVMGKEKPYEWEIAEASVHLLTTDVKMRKFWPTIEIEVYPEIEEILKKVEPIWRKNSFENYLRDSYRLFNE